MEEPGLRRRRSGPPAMTIGYLPQDGLSHTGHKLCSKRLSPPPSSRPAGHEGRDALTSKHRAGRHLDSRGDHHQMLDRSYSRAAGSLPASTRATASTCLHRRPCCCSSASGQEDLERPDRYVLGRLADAHRAGQAAARRAQPTAAWTSLRTTSTSTRATGWRNTLPTTRTR